MSSIYTIFKRDIFRMMYSGIVVTLIVLFLLFMGALFFTDFFQSIQTLSLRSFFSQAPLLLSIFCPALTMGILSEEKKSQTLDLLMTMPVQTYQIVIAKFLSCLVLLFFVLLFTLSYPISLSTLGELDWGPVAGGYIALMMLGGIYLSIGILSSAVSKDQVSSFLLSFFLCFLLTYIHRLSLESSGTAASVLQSFSASMHFSNIARGVVDIRDIIYAISIQIIMLISTCIAIDIHKYPKKISL